MSCVYDSLTPLYCAAKLFGLAPHRRVKNDYYLSKMSFFYTSVAAAFTLLNVSLTIVEFPFYPPQALMLFITKCLVYMNVGSTVVIYIVEMRYQRRFGLILRKLHRVDGKIENMGLRIDHSRIGIGVFMGVFVFLSLSTAVTILDFVAYSDDGILYERIMFTLLFIIPLVVHGCMSCIVCCYVSIIRSRLFIINNIILDGILKENSKRRSHVEVLKDIKDIHHKLCLIYTEIGSIYSMPILFAIALGFAYIFIRLYFYCSAFRHNNTEFFRPLTLIHILTVMVFHVVIISGLVLTNESCKIEAKKSAQIVIRIARTTKDSSLINIVRLFVLQITVTRIGIYAAEIFSVDRKFVTMLFSSGVTYLVILVQFDLSTI